ncbi:hypothetical protein SDC9_104575 [bioreactor metagenome]|uniref:Uncharacterized protein n=1 Tax=bioreactor metagenome TaxID=1076179 RepID=A0A645AWY4_9ZZZZ
MLTKNTEQTRILIFLKCFHYRTDITSFPAKVKLTSHLLVGTNVQLGNMDMLHYRRILCQCGIHIFHTRTIDIIMSLHTNTIDGHALFFHGFNHVVNTVSLSWVRRIIIVVKE